MNRHINRLILGISVVFVAILATMHLFASTLEWPRAEAGGRFSASLGPHWLPVEPEDRCPSYSPHDWWYPRSIEARIVDGQYGAVWGPYTDRLFADTSETDIEHIVARHEAAQSGGCEWPKARKRSFSQDMVNLTLASPEVNRQQKGDHDPAQWLPERNRCWYVDRWVRVKIKYGLSADAAEKAALLAVFSGCEWRATAESPSSSRR